MTKTKKPNGLGDVQLPDEAERAQVLERIAHLHDRVLDLTAHKNSLAEELKDAKAAVKDAERALSTYIRVHTHESDLPLVNQLEQDRRRLET